MSRDSGYNQGEALLIIDEFRATHNVDTSCDNNINIIDTKININTYQ